jgi:spore maturation protein CgeB
MGDPPLQPVSAETLRPLQFSDGRCVERTRAHLHARRQGGEIGPLPERPRVFAAVRDCNWERAGLVEPWRPIAEVVHFDWADAGYDQYAVDWDFAGKPAFNEELVHSVTAAHERSAIDVFFSYLSGRWVFPDTIRRIASLGIITVNYDFDDVADFWGTRTASGLTGSAEIAPAYDICVTAQSQANVAKYIYVAANPLFMPSGGNETVFGRCEPPETRSIPISFVGQCYGERPVLIEHLKRNGLDVSTWGEGWPAGPLSQDEMIDVYHRSLITLGFGYIGEGKQVGLKGRDFEVPMTGTCYVTTWNNELDRFFARGKELMFYLSPDHLVAVLKELLDDPERTVEIGRAGRRRALADHTWTSRWQSLLDVCR